MNLKLVARLVGGMLVPILLCVGACFVFALWQWQQSGYEAGRGEVATGLGISCAVFAVSSLVLFFCGRSVRARDILRRDVVGVVALGWIVVSLFGSLPYLLAHNGHGISFPKAFFESVSGFTTTGSTIYADLEVLPEPLLLWRAMCQWLGGLGIVVLFAALLPSLGLGGKSLMSSESTIDVGRAPTSRVGDLAKRCWVLYTALTVACGSALWCIGRFTKVELGSLDAVLYGMTTVATGGFAPHNRSVGHFDSLAVEVVMVVFMLISALSMLLLIHLAWRGRTKMRTGRTEAVVFLVVVLASWLLVWLDLCLNGDMESSIGEKLRASMFPVASMATSGGFATTDYDQWPLFARIMIAFLMIMGGCTGSTAGGLKIMRGIVLYQVLRQQVTATYRPRLVKLTRLDGVTLSAEAGFRVLVYIATCAAITAASTFILALLEPGIDDLSTALGGVLATFYNMGPGFGELGPTDTFANLHGHTLVFLSLLMLLGRLEIFVLLAVFTRSFWRKF